MAFAFNPITGKLDLVGSGGSATTDASLLTSGTLADARLSSNVSLDNINNNFTAGQTITAAANTSALTASYSVTGANTTPLLDLSGTWNTTGVARGILLNITDTASGASSALIDLQTNGTSRFGLTRGISSLAGNASDLLNWGIESTIFRAGSFYGNAALGLGTGTNNNFIIFGSLNSFMSIGGGTGGFQFSSGTGSVRLFTESENTLAQRNGTNAQTFRLYGTFTDASNARRLDITSTTGGIFTLTATGNGTGASGNILKLTAPVLIPASSVTLATNGDLAFEATSNTSLTIRYRGSDGTTRSASLTLA